MVWPGFDPWIHIGSPKTFQGSFLSTEKEVLRTARYGSKNKWIRKSSKVLRQWSKQWHALDQKCLNFFSLLLPSQKVITWCSLNIHFLGNCQTSPPCPDTLISSSSSTSIRWVWHVLGNKAAPAHRMTSCGPRVTNLNLLVSLSSGTYRQHCQQHVFLCPKLNKVQQENKNRFP